MPARARLALFLAQVALWLLWARAALASRLGRRWAAPPRPAAPVVSPEWLTTQLQNRQLCGAQVRVAAIQPHVLQRNHRRTVTRLALTYTIDGAALAVSEGGPSSVVLKCSDPGAESRAAIMELGEVSEGLVAPGACTRASGCSLPCARLISV